ncbi:MAG: hypothetical protein ABIT20_17030 [Gemmatimonadaceae bacterium]
MRFRFRTVAPAAIAFIAACSSSDALSPDTSTIVSSNPVTMTVLGRGDFKPVRTTGEIFVRGTTAYTTTWGNTFAQASAFYIWDVAADVPRLVDSVKVDNAQTLGDIAVSDDGGLLVVAAEYVPGAILVYSLANPRQPVLLSRFQSPQTIFGVHTAEIGRVNGKLYAFLGVDPGSGVGSQLTILDLSTPANPQQVFSTIIGSPYVHDTFVRDGVLYLGLWNAGVAIWDIGGGGLGGTPSVPKEIGRVRTVNGHVHNIWWLKDPVTGINRYAFIGEESPGSVGASSSGDVHVVDVSTMSAPKEVAYYTVAGAGTHNFSVDEPNGILYAAYYNGGVRALDVRGDLGTCTAAQKSTPLNGTIALCDLRKMGRELGIGLLNQGNSVYVWGVQYQGGMVYASDMPNGIWKLRAVSRP